MRLRGGEVVRGQITWDITGFDEDLALVKREARRFGAAVK